jgi:hypothetical protein
VNTARFTEAIERHVRAHPEQWFWVHAAGRAARHEAWAGTPGAVGRCSSPAAWLPPRGRSRPSGRIRPPRSLRPSGASARRAACGGASRSRRSPRWRCGRRSTGSRSPSIPPTPTLVAELERIRQSARGSATQYESAVARVQSALTVHQGRIDRQTAQPPTLGDLLVAEPPTVKQAPPRRPCRPPRPSPPHRGELVVNRRLAVPVQPNDPSA